MPSKPTPWFRPATTVWTIAVVLTWLTALVPTGLALHDLASFAPLGTMLWLGFSATRRVVGRQDWSWRSILRAALLGAGVLPPIIAVLVAMAGIDRPQQLLMLFVYGAWITIAAGAVTGALARKRGSHRRGFVRRSAAAVRERVLQRSALRRFWRGTPAAVLVQRAERAAGDPPPLNRAPAGTPAPRPR